MLATGGTTSQARSALNTSNHTAARLITQQAEKDLCPQYMPHILIRFSGNGILNSAPFNVTSGTVTAKYTYSNCAGGSGNFIADMTDGSDDQPIANALGSGGSQTTTLYPTDTPGQYHLEIDSECSWTVVVKTR